MLQFTVHFQPVDGSKERIIVHGRNGQLVFESNRPRLLKYGMRHRRPDIKLVEGKLKEVVFVEMIVEAIWAKLKER